MTWTLEEAEILLLLWARVNLFTNANILQLGKKEGKATTKGLLRHELGRERYLRLTPKLIPGGNNNNIQKHFYHI